MADFIETTKEASSGGFRGIKKIRGLLLDLRLVPPRFETSDYGEPKNQIEFVLDDAHILEMSPGEEEFELKDNRYVGWVSYAAQGKTPHANSSYIKCWVASAEKLGRKPSDFIGQYVTLEKLPVVLFKQAKVGSDKKAIVGEDGKKIYEEIVSTNTFCFVSDETSGSESVDDYIKSLVVGLNQKAALRKLLVETRAKQYPKYKDSLNAGTLAEELGLVLIDDKFTAKGE